nr:MAG TPA: hypothetical protein [Caudoviricetes sp.]
MRCWCWKRLTAFLLFRESIVGTMYRVFVPLWNNYIVLHFCVVVNNLLKFFRTSLLIQLNQLVID